MLLAIDIGNSTIYMGLIENDEVKKSFRITTDKDKLADDYNTIIRETLKQNIEFNQIEDIIISSVVPEITEEVEKAIYNLLDKKALVLKKDIKIPSNMHLEEIKDLGDDLISNSIGAIAKYSLPILIFDMGTATTCSVINRKGEFCGGVICPGIKVSAAALINKASALSAITLGNPKKVVGKETAECINSGVIYGHSSIINGLRKMIEEETQEKYTVVITGGNSNYVAKYIDEDIIQDENLIFYGLNELYKSY